MELSNEDKMSLLTNADIVSVSHNADSDMFTVKARRYGHEHEFEIKRGDERDSDSVEFAYLCGWINQGRYNFFLNAIE